MSIFSINDNSNYNSILSQAKANKESKENSKISFANAFLKQNASKLNEIQSANSQTLIRSEVLNSTNTTNTSNNTNFSISSKTSSPNYDISSEFKNSIYTLKYKQADINTNTAYGYSVDKDGYMGSDFNKAAGLPKDFKIHKSTLDEIQRYNENSYFFADKKEYLGISGNYFTNIDMADTIKQYYNQFNQIINHTFNDTNKTSFSEADLNSLPKGYSVSDTNKDFASLERLDTQTITNYYNTQEQYDEMEQLGTIASISLGLQPLDFTPQSMQTQNLDQDSARDTFNPDMSVYPKNEDGTYTKEDLFMSFLKASGGEVLAGGDTKINPIIQSFREAMAKESFDGSLASLDDIMTGKVDFASLLKGYAQDGWLDADIYAMEKGIKWQNHIGYGGGAWFERELNQAKANGWKASSESINSYVNSIMDRLNNLIGQTRV
ncbi:Cj0814 family flagellar-dependent secreted protein [Campylobacter sp. LH-2024]|uniref:Cj0814 family flagellar-dependent secreted protein n=1 Tax=Campylobacter sp. LH-2024 TaxID=3239825 RepID=UPI003AA9CB4F